ncbi:DUF3348 family protein [Stenotrophomonas sp. HITSZ_GD]|uniref:DUF3348 family protein n=1 Tax=Stenotrophomonas sp. HITSZ_GD TaxID=3037248 RepID=UPI00240DBFE8|nr:DUF3348 family protein [Stenotrophomonas sp. HITSZ_GD]MDG2524001.1 DUF3348 family protein [Stenotrophomonas sp. HITSZ_GD]
MAGIMAESTTRALVSAPPFIRLLAGLGQADAGRSPPVLTERLEQWIDWNHAVSLARALDQPPPPAPESVEDAVGEADCARAREALVQSINQEPLLARRPPPGSLATRDFAPYQERCLSLQRAMHSATGRLRGLLRDRLAAGPEPLARLAEVDALMEQVLSPREQRWLAAVPSLLAERFARLRPGADDAAAGPPSLSDDALDAFRQEMRDVLLAELDFRFQPLEALLAALRA